MPRRSCSGAGKEEGKNAERRCRRKRHGPGLVDDGASRAHEVFSACRGRRAHAVGLRVLKPKRARAGKEESRHSLAPLSLVLASWSVSGTSRPLPHCSDCVCHRGLCRRHTPVGISLDAVASTFMSSRPSVALTHSPASPAGLTRGSIRFARAFCKEDGLHRTRACPSSALLRAASRVDPTCGVKPGNDRGETVPTILHPFERHPL